MKKMLLAAIGLTGLLASCGPGLVPDENFTPGAGYSQTLQLKDISYTTNYQTKVDYKDQNGNLIAAGSYLICDNLNTTLTTTVNWTGTLKDLYVQFKGFRTGTEKTALYSSWAGDSSGSASVDYVLTPGMAPQAIVVNPTIVNVKGNTYVRVQGVDQNGNHSNIITGVTTLPIVDCQ